MSFYFRCFDCPGNYKYRIYPKGRWVCPNCNCPDYAVEQVDD